MNEELKTFLLTLLLIDFVVVAYAITHYANLIF